jgi:hypothetical protein
MMVTHNRLGTGGPMGRSKFESESYRPRLCPAVLRLVRVNSCGTSDTYDFFLMFTMGGVWQNVPALSFQLMTRSALLRQLVLRLH